MKQLQYILIHHSNQIELEAYQKAYSKYKLTGISKVDITLDHIAGGGYLKGSTDITKDYMTTKKVYASFDKNGELITMYPLIGK